MKTSADVLFFSQIDKAVEIMSNAGINDTLIAVVVQDIRSATLNEEYRRIQRMIELNPPIHDSWCDMAKDLSDRGS